MALNNILNNAMTGFIDDDTFSTASSSTAASSESIKNYIGSIVGGGHIAKNFIIGGNFGTNPWQRGTSFSSVAGGQYVADRWTNIGVNDAVINYVQTADSPTVLQAGIFSQYCMEFDVATADTTIAADQASYFKTIIEGYTFSQFAQQEVTLSFWVKSLKTGIFCVAVSNGSENATPPPPVFPNYQSCVFEYTINAADTWEKKTITIPATPASGVWQYGIGRGYQIYFMQAAGTDWQTSNTGVWQTHPGAGVYLATANQVNNLDSNSNYFKINLVQLELGDSATAFEVRPFQQELALCQRYFQKSFNLNVTPASATNANGAVKYAVATAGVGAGGTYTAFPVRMRIDAPSVTFYNPQAAGSNWRNISTTTSDSGTSSVVNIGSSGLFMRNPQVAGDLAGNIIAIHYTVDAEL